MKHIIIGTAGHIDHGKTTLIKALTGRETDTLKEEKDRGISINLGFTYFDLPSGKRAGIIDVPGHEKFIKNMLAGISGIDVVLLVIAADEGIMPQTREHLEILQLLNVKKGIIVLTKCDLVDSEWISMIKEDIKNEFKDTFLENAPIHEVSSKTKKGFKELIEDIEVITEEVEPKDTEGHFRLPIDRVFTVKGFGTIVTGTVISGKVKLGDTIEIYPSKILTKARGIRVHGQEQEVGEAGQRVAINLANVKVEEINRGNVLAKENTMEPSYIIDCNLYYLKSLDKPLINRQRVRLYHGTEEIIGRVVLLDKDELKPGERAYVQLKLEKPITAQRNDRYVLRNYSPMVTIAGGTIIEPVAKKCKRFDEEYIKELKIKESGESENILENVVKKLSENYPDKLALIKGMGKNLENIEEQLEKLIKNNSVIKLNSLESPIYVHREFMNNKIKAMEELLTNFHKKNPLKFGMSKEEIKNKVFGKNLKQKNYDEILQILQEKNIIKLNSKFISLYDFQIKFTKDQEEIKNYIIKEYELAKYNCPKYFDLVSKIKDKESFKMVFNYLLDSEMLIKINEDCILTKDNYNKAKEIIKKYIETNGSINASTARETLETNRKYAVAILEHLDSIKFTKRIENDRILY